MSQSSNKNSRLAWLVGAVELALLDRLRSKYVDQPNRQILYVIDFPNLVQVHCVPPVNVDIAETTGFLPVPKPERSWAQENSQDRYTDQAYLDSIAREHTGALGLTELLARYVFERRWSKGAPKLMLHTQVSEAARLESAIKNASMREWESTSRNINKALQQLESLASRNKGNIPAFVQAAVEAASDTLPALYGKYSGTRQFMRFRDVSPQIEPDFGSDHVIFLNSVPDLMRYVKNILNTKSGAEAFERIVIDWQSALIKISGVEDEKTAERRSDDARTLALIEYINGCLDEDKVNLQLVYLTAHARIFDAALLRYGVLNGSSINKLPLVGSRHARNRARYSAYLLLGSGNISKVPILDPRVLTTARDFVDYAAEYGGEENGKEKIQSITEWLPLFFNGVERDEEKIARSYLVLNGLISKRDSSEFSDVLQSEDFGSAQYAALDKSWAIYIAATSAAYGFSKIQDRQYLKDLLVAAFVGAKPSDVMDAIRDQMSKVMGEWLPAVASATFEQILQASATADDHHTDNQQIGRMVAPLLFPAFKTIQSDFTALFAWARNRRQLARPEVPWLKNPTPENLNIGCDWSSGVGLHRVNYIHALGLSYGFAVEGNWPAAYRLSSISVALARTIDDKHQERDLCYISGREAAYLCSFSARRRCAGMDMRFIPRVLPGQYYRDFEDALKKEESIFKNQLGGKKWAAHELRLEAEKIAWTIFERLVGIAISENITGSTTRSAGVQYGFDYRLEDLQEKAMHAEKLYEYFQRQSIEGYTDAMLHVTLQIRMGVIQLLLLDRYHFSEWVSLQDRSKYVESELDEINGLVNMRSESKGLPVLELAILKAAEAAKGGVWPVDSDNSVGIAGDSMSSFDKWRLMKLKVFLPNWEN